MGEDFREVRKDSQERRQEHRRRSPIALREAGIAFTSHNEGAHLIVAGEWDFWPGTGKWCHRGPPKKEGRGVFNLINRIKAP